MEEHTGQGHDDNDSDRCRGPNVNAKEDLSSVGKENDAGKMPQKIKEINSETDGDFALESELEKSTDNKQVMLFHDDDDNDINVCTDEILSCSGGKEQQGNLLNSVVTMHNMTNCDDDYAPTLAICDIFNKSKASPTQAPIIQNNEENKDEFLIIDLDTCQMERSAHKVDEYERKKQRRDYPPKDLVLVNLSSQDDTQPDFLNNDIDSSSEDNFLFNSNDSDSQRNDHKEKLGTKNAITESMRKDGVSSQAGDSKSMPEFKLVPKDADVKRENSLQNKGILFQDVSMNDESTMCKEMYSADVGFHSSELNEVCFNSNANQETEQPFYMPELYSKHYEEDKNDQPSNNQKVTSRFEADNGNEFYEYSINDSASFDTPFASNQYNCSNDYYEHQRVQNANQYNFESKIISNLLGMDTKDTSSPYGSRYPENTYCYNYKNRVSATIGCNKFSSYANTQEQTTSQFFHPPFRPTYRATYLHNSMQQPNAVHTQLTPSSNYSDWNPWSNSGLFEVNLNAFSSVHNANESQCNLGKEWCNDTVIDDLYHDSEMSLKCNQTEIDSEATEDADETDDVPIFFDDSTEFSTCDNLSTISVMSSSCYSDSSSVMAPMSPSDFTPPPSVSNTPMSSNHDISVTEEHQCDQPFVNDSSRSEPLHLYSPTMLSVTPYKLSNEKSDPNLVSYDRNQGIKRYYPSMADMHNSRSGLSLRSASTKFKTEEIFANTNQIQSDKISTSTSRNAHNKKNADIVNYRNQPRETFAYCVKPEENDFQNDSRRLRHNEPLKQTAIRIMSQWYEDHLDNPYPTKEDKMKMARDGGITITQVKSWFANKRNRTNNTKPKVQKRAMKEKLKKLFQDLKHSRSDSLDNSHIIQQLSGIIQT